MVILSYILCTYDHGIQICVLIYLRTLHQASIYLPKHPMVPIILRTYIMFSKAWPIMCEEPSRLWWMAFLTGVGFQQVPCCHCHLRGRFACVSFVLLAVVWKFSAACMFSYIVLGWRIYNIGTLRGLFTSESTVWIFVVLHWVAQNRIFDNNNNNNYLGSVHFSVRGTFKVVNVLERLKSEPECPEVCTYIISPEPFTRPSMWSSVFHRNYTVFLSRRPSILTYMWQDSSLVWGYLWGSSYLFIGRKIVRIFDKVLSDLNKIKCLTTLSWLSLVWNLTIVWVISCHWEL